MLKNIDLKFHCVWYKPIQGKFSVDSSDFYVLYMLALVTKLSLSISYSHVPSDKICFIYNLYLISAKH